MILDYKDINDLNRYKIMSTTVVPRPIAWIVTVDEGVINAAPFSYFIPLSSNPATLVVSIGQKEGGIPKDSLANILKHKKATICFANEENLEQLKLSSNALDKSESEVEKYAIQVEDVLKEYPPMIRSSQAALFCDFHSTIELGGKTTPVILEIKKQYIEDERINEKMYANIENIGRKGATFAKMVDI